MKLRFIFIFNINHFIIYRIIVLTFMLFLLILQYLH